MKNLQRLWSMGWMVAVALGGARAAAAPPSAAPSPASPVAPVGSTTPSPASPASAPPTHYEYRFSVYLEARILWLTNPGYDLFSERDEAPGPGATVEVDLLRWDGGSVLSSEFGLLTEWQDDTAVGGELSAELGVTDYHLGVRARRELLPWLSVHGRTTLGVSDAEISFETLDTNRQYHQSPWFYHGALGFGGTVQLPPLYRVGAGLIVEGGYHLSTGTTLRLTPRLPDNPIEVATPSLGHLGRSGPYLRAGLFVRF